MWFCDVFKKGLHGSLILVSCILFVLYVYLVLFGLASAHYYELLGYWPAFLAKSLSTFMQMTFPKIINNKITMILEEYFFGT